MDNERKYGVRVTNEKINKSDPFIERSKERLAKIYDYCKDFKNGLTPLFEAFLVNNKDLGGIPMEKQPGLFDNLANTRKLIDETMLSVENLYHSDEFWRSLRRDYLNSGLLEATRIFQEIYERIDIYSKIEDKVKNIISYFKSGKVKNKITEKGYGFISRSVGVDKDVYFHLTALRGMKFEDIEPDLNVLFIEKEREKGMEAMLVFRNFSNIRV